jgi:hypothetical protein
LERTENKETTGFFMRKGGKGLWQEVKMKKTSYRMGVGWLVGCGG